MSQDGESSETGTCAKVPVHPQPHLGTETYFQLLSYRVDVGASPTLHGDGNRVESLDDEEWDGCIPYPTWGRKLSRSQTPTTPDVVHSQPHPGTETFFSGKTTSIRRFRCNPNP